MPMAANNPPDANNANKRSFFFIPGLERHVFDQMRQA
jgi:hypothetical protein